MKWFSFFLIAIILPAMVQGQNAATQPAEDLSLGKLFRSRVAGIEFQPPASGTLSSVTPNGEVVRYVNVEQSWDLNVKAVPLHTPLPLMGVGGDGVISLIKTQLLDANPTAQILSSDVQNKRQVDNGAPFGLIQARYDSATDRIFSQQAIFRESNRYYLILQMTSHGKSKTDTSSKPDPEENFAKDLFSAVLNTVHVLDRSLLRAEQDTRINNTRLFWMGLDENKITSTLQPLHFIRLVQDGKDVGFIQMNERTAVHSGNPGFEILVHSRLLADLVKIPDATQTQAGMKPKKDQPSYYYTSSSFFVTFDRRHEGWTTITQRDDDVKFQTTESANSDQTSRLRLDTTQAAIDARTVPTSRPHGEQPPVKISSNYMLDVAYATGPHQDKPTDIKLPPYYLPQAISQLLPRLLPSEPGKYMFAFYVSGQRNVLARYVDVAAQREVDIDDQKMVAIPITDRIGADGTPTIHYVTRQGQWLGSVTEETHLKMLPTDESTLKTIWPNFVATPEPTPQPTPQPAPQLQNTQGSGR